MSQFYDEKSFEKVFGIFRCGVSSSTFYSSSCRGRILPLQPGDDRCEELPGPFRQNVDAFGFVGAGLPTTASKPNWDQRKKSI